MSQKAPDNTPKKWVVLSSEIEWEKLNPARGDQSPRAGTIWGDRKDTLPTGFLAKFVDGFSSPPHIHNVTYRAVVIKGLIHNDDPDAANMWMKPGSFWTQPAGESHITSAKGKENIALVEIDKGPYLVKPISEAFDNGERPINIDKSNILWLDESQSKMIDSNSNAELSFLHENNGYTSLFVKLPKGFDGELMSFGSVFHAVIISGEIGYQMSKNEKFKNLDLSSYFGSNMEATHILKNNANEESVLYIRTNGSVSIR